ncbi:unnamed protein product [Chondrus crispus]|uniref:Integrase catalytic domain-containing protein n=1 Tax=Chondrus crispus TaxID=2769 RepID=R7Q465_CHOCR|nr:unnamed protein product [Chondrus crispus]CDF33317.1 unnamed protein product [Chondrus crispus]|eukprot:XP_005713120.1 unnamed protein product [Chondrus crispus]
MGQNGDDGSTSQHDLSTSFESAPNDTEVIEALLSSADVNINLAHAEDSPLGGSTEHVGSSQATIEVDATGDSDCEGYLLTVFEDMTDEDEVIISMSTDGKQERADFLGACIDTGAQRSVIGKPQAEAYYIFMGIPFCLEQSGHPRVYKFGAHRYKGLGSVFIRIPVDSNQFIFTEVQVVDLDVPLLLGLEFLDQYGMKVQVSENLLTSEEGGWKLPLTRKLGHLYLEWCTEMLYTSGELRKIHRHFFHPTSDRLYAVMKRADPEHCSPQDLHKLEDVTARCDVCQRLSRAPSRFRVSLPHKDIVFNRILCVDIMFLDKKVVLHCVDKDTKFNSAAFISDQTVDTLWSTYQKIWSLPYAGHPEHMHADQGPQFESRRWEGLCHLAGIELTLSGVEEHNALGEGERYHAYLRQVYNKFKADFPTIDAEYALQIAIKAVNDTAGPRGLVPTLLVFGIAPRTLVSPLDLPHQKKRMQALVTARNEMARTIAQRRINTALSSNVPAAAASDMTIGTYVLVHRESPVSKWIGPYRICDTFGKHVFFDVKGRFVKFSVDKVKPYKRDPSAGAMEDRAVLPQDTTSDTERSNQEYSKVFDDLLASDEPIRADEFCISEESLSCDDVYLTKLLSPGDPDCDSSYFRAAQFAEVQGLRERETWDVVKKRDMPTGANVLGGRFVLAIKNFGLKEEKPKARYVDLQFFEMSADDALDLRKPLYGNGDSGDYWRVTFDRHARQDLKMTPTDGDPSLFILVQVEPSDDSATEVEQAEGCMGNYVDDSLLAGNKAFQELTNATLRKFESRERIWDSFEFFGCAIKTIAPGQFTISQVDYLSKVGRVPDDCSFNLYRSVRAEAAWATHTRPDVSCAVNRAAQVPKGEGEDVSSVHVSVLNSAIKRMKSSPELSLRFDHLDESTLQLRAYTDASFGANEDFSSQLGYIVLLCDSSNRCHILDFASKKSKRIVRCILGGEVYAFTEGFDCAFVLRHDLQKLYGRTIPLQMRTDSKQMFDVIMKASHTSERRLMIDIAAAREAYNENEISNVGLVRSEHNVADGLTKPKYCKALESLLRTGKDENPVEQWIIRAPSRSSF